MVAPTKVGTGGIVSPVLPPVRLVACHSRHLAGPWRLVYVVGTILVFYLSAFVSIVRLFRRVPALIVAAAKRFRVLPVPRS